MSPIRTKALVQEVAFTHSSCYLQSIKPKRLTDHLFS